MGLLDGIKKLQDMAEQAKNVANQLKGTIGGQNQSSMQPYYTQQPTEVEPVPTQLVPDASGQVIIQSEGQMATWLDSVSAQTKSPTIMKVIDAQMQVIKFVKAPSLLGMVLDNMIAVLHQTLREASSEKEKVELRETISLMIQNLIFFSDAQLHYAIDQNKQEAKRLLSTAGDMLAKSVASVASLAAGPAAVAGVIVKNIFASEEMQNGFFGRLISWIMDSKQIEQRVADFDTSIKNLFVTFDKYAAIIGPSIQINGLLCRYEPKLVEKYRNASYESLYNLFAKEMKEFLVENQSKNLETYKKLCLLVQPLMITVPQENEIRRRDERGLAQELIRGFIGQEGLTYVKERFLTSNKENGKAIANFHYTYIQEIHQEFEQKAKRYAEEANASTNAAKEDEDQIASINAQITHINTQIASMSILQISAKKKLEQEKVMLEQEKAKFEQHHNKHERQTKKAENESAFCKKVLQKIDYYLTKTQSLDNDVQAYASGLSDTTAKYALNFQATVDAPSNSAPSNDAARQKFNKLFELALADGEISEKEKGILWKYAEAAGIDEGEFELMVENKTNII